jgi:hypothetical protein
MSERFYMVSFDLENSKYRTNEYTKIRRYLENLVGSRNYHRLTKQCCILKTDQRSAAIRDGIKQRLGSNCNILVVRLQYGYAFHLPDPVVRAEAIDVLTSIPAP